MNRSELVATVASNGGFRKSDAEKMVVCLLAAITAALKRGDEVRLSRGAGRDLRHRDQPPAW